MTPDRWRQIEDFYHRALGCAPNERAALLESTEPEVRARVERMLRVESGDRILDDSAMQLLADDRRALFNPGSQLGPYRIEAEVGRGGMGTVFRAVDTRLGRIVAIKIAAGHYSERFQLEACAISTLNHPHVCTLYDVGPDYLVMEFIEGRTLADELENGPLAPGAAARFGSEIAGALAEAHSLGIIHRDLKPGNIMFTRHGVKVLDFGLAKISPDRRADAKSDLTETGAVMGTPTFMAPEQFDGAEPSNAADLFALGLVLYEMVAGKQPFPGASLGQMLSSGSNVSVPLASRERAAVPGRFDALIGKLLNKDPAQRPQSAAAVARDLSELADQLASPPRKRRIAFVTLGAALLLGIAGVVYVRSRPVPTSPLVQANPASFMQLTAFTDSAISPALSPDGRMLAFIRSRSVDGFLNPDQIWVKLLPDGEPAQVTRDPRPKYNIAFTPDGSRIAYTAYTARGLQLFDTYTISALGGNSELFLKNAAGLGWLTDGNLLFSRINNGGVHMGIVTSKPNLAGLREIYFPKLDRGMAHYSYLSPDGKWVLLAEMDPGWHPCRVVPFSGGSIGRQVGPDGECRSAAWSPDGKWVYLGVKVAGRRHIWRQRFPDGQPEQVTSGSTEEEGIAMAPDGLSLITSIFTQQNIVWIHDVHGDRPLSTQGYPQTNQPVFSRDGRSLYYLLRRESPGSPAELVRTDLESGQSSVVVPGVSMHSFDIDDAEQSVVFSTSAMSGVSQLWIAPLDRSASPKEILSGGDLPRFGQNNEVIFRELEGSAYYLAAVKQDGTAHRRVIPGGVLGVDTLPPDRSLIIVETADPAKPNRTAPPTLAISLTGGEAYRLCDGICILDWSPNGRYLSIQLKLATREDPDGTVAVIPLGAGRALPALPEEGFHTAEQWARLPGARIIKHDRISLGPDPSVYAYIKTAAHGNLYRIPLQ